MSLKGRALFVFRGVVYTLLAISIVAALYLYIKLCPNGENELVNKSLFHPVKVKAYKPEMYLVGGISGKDVFFRTNNQSPNLHGIFYKNPRQKFVAIINHGNGSNIVFSRPAAQALLEANVSVLLYDYRGYGMSEGSATVKGVVEDANAAYNYVTRKLGYDADRVIIYGGSLGTGVSSELLKEKSCVGIIYDSPFLSPEKLAKEVLPYFRVYPSFLWFTPSLDNTQFVKTNHRPIMFLAAADDSVIPVTHGKSLFEMCSGKKEIHIFKNSQHTWYEADWEDYKQCIANFVKNLPRDD